jgi:STE24 endopeptidase
MASTANETRKSPAQSYTGRRKGMLQLRVLSWFAVWAFFLFSGASRVVAGHALKLIPNLYCAVAAVWAAFYACLFAIGVPISLGQYRVDKKFGLAKTTVTSWLTDHLKANLVAALVGFAVVEMIFLAMNRQGEYTWVIAAFAVSFLYAAFVFLLPALLPFFYRLTPLMNTDLSQRLLRLGKQAGVHIENIYVWEISKRTRKANALVGGLLGRRKVILTDTLLEVLSDDEVEAIVAHEFGHCAHRDLVKRLVLQTILFLPVLWAVHFLVAAELIPATTGGWSNPAGVPSVWLTWLVLTLYGNVIMAALIRSQERAADLFAWQNTASALPFISAMKKIGEQNLIAYDKRSQWKYTHPAIPERISAAERYAREHGQMAEAAAMSATQ